MTTEGIYEKAQEAVKFLQAKTQIKPKILIILGSGQGDYAKSIQNQVAIPYSQIPHFKVCTASGHNSMLIFGTIQGKSVVVMQGRFHLYEGHKMEEVTFPIRVAKLLGVETMIGTSVVGGLNKLLNIGDIVVLKDYINYSGRDPLMGPNDERFGVRFLDVQTCYDVKLQHLALSTMREQGLSPMTGVYLQVAGPCYETNAEIEMYRKWGADVVGMSTVPETVTAHHMGIKILCLAYVTDNFQQGVSISHDEILKQFKLGAEKLSKLLNEIVKEI